jgi:plastocyanin
MPSRTNRGVPSSSGGAVQVTIKNFAFSPDVLNARFGQTVEWTNDDAPPHNVTYVSGPSFISSSPMNSGATFSTKLTQAGTIHYYCSIHPWMKERSSSRLSRAAIPVAGRRLAWTGSLRRVLRLDRREAAALN